MNSMLTYKSDGKQRTILHYCCPYCELMYNSYCEKMNDNTRRYFRSNAILAPFPRGYYSMAEDWTPNYNEDQRKTSPMYKIVFNSSRIKYRRRAQYKMYLQN